MSVRLRLILAIIIGLLVSGCSDDWGVDQHARKVTAGELEGQWLLINYWAEWCGPCRQMAPAFAQAARDLEPGVRLAKLDTEAHPAIAGRYGIRSIPTMIMFRGGQEVARVSGALGAADIARWVRSVG